MSHMELQADVGDKNVNNGFERCACKNIDELLENLVCGNIEHRIVVRNRITENVHSCPDCTHISENEEETVYLITLEKLEQVTGLGALFG